MIKLDGLLFWDLTMPRSISAVLSCFNATDSADFRGERSSWEYTNVIMPLVRRDLMSGNLQCDFFGQRNTGASQNAHCMFPLSIVIHSPFFGSRRKASASQES